MITKEKYMDVNDAIEEMLNRLIQDKVKIYMSRNFTRNGFVFKKIYEKDFAIEHRINLFITDQINIFYANEDILHPCRKLEDCVLNTDRNAQSKMVHSGWDGLDSLQLFNCAKLYYVNGNFYQYFVSERNFEKFMKFYQIVWLQNVVDHLIDKEPTTKIETIH